MTSCRNYSSLSCLPLAQLPQRPKAECAGTVADPTQHPLSKSWGSRALLVHPPPFRVVHGKSGLGDEVGPNSSTSAASSRWWKIFCILHQPEGREMGMGLCGTTGKHCSPSPSISQTSLRDPCWNPTAGWFWGMSGQGFRPFGLAHVLPYISTTSPSNLESSGGSKPNFVQPNTVLDEHGCLRLTQLQMRAITPQNPALSSFAWRLHDPLLNMHMNWDATNFPGVSWGLK